MHSQNGENRRKKTQNKRFKHTELDKNKTICWFTVLQSKIIWMKSQWKCAILRQQPVCNNLRLTGFPTLAVSLFATWKFAYVNVPHATSYKCLYKKVVNCMSFFLCTHTKKNTNNKQWQTFGLYEKSVSEVNKMRLG